MEHESKKVFVNFTQLPMVLNSFEPISLEQMDNVTLMDRVDKKYIFSQPQLSFFLNGLKETYRVLEVFQYRSITYKSLYFDTPSFDFYQQHHSGKLNRFKIRYRNYAENNLSFFEIKLKSNKGRTVKSRIPIQTMEESICHNAKKFLESKTNLLAKDLHPALWITYKRITLVNRFSAERITIDTDISFENKEGIKNTLHLVVAEVKQEKSGYSPFVKLMRSHCIREGFMSKYCLGLSCLMPLLKKNNFKRSLTKLHKLQPHVSTDLE